MSSLPLLALGGQAGFTQDPRFSGAANPPPPLPEPEREDPVALAWAEGYEAGVAEAGALAKLQAEADEAARGTIELAMSRANRDTFLSQLVDAPRRQT